MTNMETFLNTLDKELREWITYVRKANNRKSHTVDVKMKAITVMREDYGMSYPLIAAIFSSDTSTIIHLYKKVRGVAAIGTPHRIGLDGVHSISPLEPVRKIYSQCTMDRAQQIRREALETGSLAVVARAHGISRERVRQLCKIADPDTPVSQILLERLRASRRMHCLTCNIEFQAKTDGRKYCSFKCKPPKYTPEQRAEILKERQKKNWQKYTAWHRNKLATDPVYREEFKRNQRAYLKTYYADKKYYAQLAAKLKKAI